jgi:hypothetical protein
VVALELPDHRNQDAAQQLLEKSGGEVVFEGDPASLSDVDSVAQTMLAAMGVPEVHALRSSRALAFTTCQMSWKM